MCAWDVEAVAEEPIEVVPMGISRSVRAGAIALSRSDSGSAGTAADDVARPCNAWGTALITREPVDTSDCDTAAPWPAGLVVGGGEENGVSVDAAYAATLGGDSIYGRPILPVGQIFGAPTAAEVTRFRALARAYRSPGLSFFDLDGAPPQALAALSAPLPLLAHRPILAPTVHAGACGDEIVQAQELLDAAGAHLPVGGYFGAETARAVASFQSRHRLAPSGALGPATWRALLRLHPREPSWASAPPVCEQ